MEVVINFNKFCPNCYSIVKANSLSGKIGDNTLKVKDFRCDKCGIILLRNNLLNKTNKLRINRIDQILNV